VNENSHPPPAKVPLTPVIVPFLSKNVLLSLPENPFALGDDLRSPDVNIYWAALWPSALALADALLAGEIQLPAGGTVLETGCGTGLASIAAALSHPSIDMFATDIEVRALELTRANAEANGVGARVRTGRLDWRSPVTQKYRTILAADCLYETGADTQLAQFIGSALEPGAGSRAIVVDPERHSARNFQYVLREAGFQVRSYLRTVPFVTALGPLGGIEAQTLFKSATRTGTAQVRFYEITID
jgi:predicted nicotinamide N-methyase